MQQMKETCGQHQHLRRTIQQQHNLPFQQHRRGAVGTLGHHALRQERKRVILQQLLQRADGQHMVNMYFLQPCLQAGQTAFIHRVLQVHHAQADRNRVANLPHFANQLRRRQNAAKQGDAVADGLVEPLMRSPHDAFGQRRRNPAANRPAHIEAQRAVHTVRQYDRVTRHQLCDDFPHIKKRFDFAQGDALPDAASDFAG